MNKFINTRKIQNPSNSLYHFYGNSINNATDKVYYLDKNGDRRVKVYDIQGSKYLKNDYPDCNCVNSHFVKLPPSGDDGTRLSADQTATVQQLQDAYCRNSPNGSYVRSISDSNVQLCVNIASNIKALATDDAEINLNQSCKPSTKVTNRTSKKVDMDNEDNKKEKLDDKKTDNAKKEEKKEKIAKALDKVNEKEASDEKKKQVENVPAQQVADTPTQQTTDTPTQQTTDTPTQQTTDTPTQQTTDTPTQQATDTPTQQATDTPTQQATDTPTQSNKTTESKTDSSGGMVVVGGISAALIFIIIIAFIMLRK